MNGIRIGSFMVVSGIINNLYSGITYIFRNSSLEILSKLLVLVSFCRPLDRVKGIAFEIISKTPRQLLFPGLHRLLYMNRKAALKKLIMVVRCLWGVVVLVVEGSGVVNTIS